MRKSLINARAAIRPLLAAGFLLALAFTFCSCASLHGARKITPEEYGKIQVVDSTYVKWVSWQFLHIPPDKKDLEYQAVAKLKRHATLQGYQNIEIRNIEVQGHFGWASLVFGYFPCMAYIFCNFQHITAYGDIVKTTDISQ
jgi:hypothetical protein